MSMKKANAVKAATMIQNIEKRNMEAVYCETKEDALEHILSYINKESVVSWGGSQSAKDIGLMDIIKTSGDYTPIDRSAGKNATEQRELFGKAMLSDYFIMGSNAITLDGELINIDGTGNRLASLCYGPAHVVIIVGMNKVVNNVKDGIARVRNIASPPNTIRLGKKTPCALTGRCGDCYSEECICNQILVTRRSRDKERIHIVLVGESVGF
ncbi:MAG: lactate utilization protein [Anaerostipes sp.]|nr:lactate utilization protein [Anaerostipes sp.]